MKTRNCFIKRGELRDHVLSIIVGVVCLGLLVLTVGYLMQAYTAGEHERAVSALKTIEKKLNALEEGGTTRFPLQGPTGWYLQGWSVSDASRPERCYFKSCICACKERSAASCQEPQTGTCTFLTEKELFVGSEAYLLTAGRGDTGGNVPAMPVPSRSATRERCPLIFFSDSLLEVELVKQKDRLELMYYSDVPLQREACSRLRESSYIMRPPLLQQGVT